MLASPAELGDLLFLFSEHKHNEIQLRMSASVFESAGKGIVITDPENRIVDVNPAYTVV